MRTQSGETPLMLPRQMSITSHDMRSVSSRVGSASYCGSEMGDGPDVEQGELLFEIEHHVEPKQKGGRPTPHLHKEEKTDPYLFACQALVSSVCELLDEVQFHRFSIVVNRRVLRAQEREAAKKVKFPCHGPQPSIIRTPKSSTALGGLSPSASTLGTTVQDNPQDGEEASVPSPPCPRARRTAAARYPREGSFEVTVYDTQRRTHRVLYSKYHKHELPHETGDIWATLMPFMIIFAGQSNDESLMNAVGGFAESRELLVRLSVAELNEVRASSLLLEFLAGALEDLRENMLSGDPECVDGVIQGIPHGLRTEDVFAAEQRLEHLCNVERRVGEALEKIESGLVTSGMESLQRAIEYATQEGLCGEVMETGINTLRSVNEGMEGGDENAADETAPGEARAGSKEADKDGALTDSGSERSDEGRKASQTSVDEEHDAVSDLPQPQRSQSRQPTAGRSSSKEGLFGVPEDEPVVASPRRRSSRMSTMSDMSRVAHSHHSSIASNDSSPRKSNRLKMGGLWQRRASGRSAMEKAEAEIASQKESLEALKTKLILAAKEFTIGIGDDQAGASLASIQPVPRARSASPDGGSEPGLSMTSWDTLITEIQSSMIEQRSQTQKVRAEMVCVEAEHAQAQAKAEMQTQQHLENLQEEVRARHEVFVGAQTVETQAIVTIAAERALAELEAERAVTARETCDKAIALAITYDTRARATAKQEELVSQEFARKAFECEVAVCDAMLQMEVAQRSEFSEFLACEDALAQVAVAEAEADEAALRQAAVIERAAEQTREEISSCKALADEAIVREALNSKIAIEQAAAREASALERLAREQVASEKAMADAAALEMKACEDLSCRLADAHAAAEAAAAREDEIKTDLTRQLEETRDALHRAVSQEALSTQEASERDSAAQHTIAQQRVGNEELQQKLHAAQEVAAYERACFEKSQDQSRAQEAARATDKLFHAQLDSINRAQLAKAEQALAGVSAELQSEKQEAQQTFGVLEGQIATARDEAREAHQAARSAMEEMASFRIISSSGLRGNQETERSIVPTNLPDLQSAPVVDNQSARIRAAGTDSLGSNPTLTTELGHWLHDSSVAPSLLVTSSSESRAQAASEVGRSPAALENPLSSIDQGDARIASVDAPSSTDTNGFVFGQGFAQPEPVSALTSWATDHVPPLHESSAVATSLHEDRAPRENVASELGVVIAGADPLAHREQQRNEEVVVVPHAAHVPSEAAPGEAPFIDDERGVEPRVELDMQASLSAVPNASNNASRGEAPMEAQAAEAAPGEAPFGAYESEQPNETARAPPPAETYFLQAGASTGEAPQIDGDQNAAPPQVQPQANVSAFHSTGWAPHLEEASIPASHSTGGMDGSPAHSTGEAPQIGPPGRSQTEQSPSTESITASSGFHGVASHSTGEAPQNELLQVPLGQGLAIPVTTAMATQNGAALRDASPAHSTGEAPHIELPQENHTEIQYDVIAASGFHAVASHSTGEAPQNETLQSTPEQGSSIVMPTLMTRTDRIVESNPTEALPAHSTGEAPFDEQVHSHEAALSTTATGVVGAPSSQILEVDMAPARNGQESELLAGEPVTATEEARMSAENQVGAATSSATGHSSQVRGLTPAEAEARSSEGDAIQSRSEVPELSRRPIQSDSEVAASKVKLSGVSSHDGGEAKSSLSAVEPDAVACPTITMAPHREAHEDSQEHDVASHPEGGTSLVKEPLASTASEHDEVVNAPFTVPCTVDMAPVDDVDQKQIGVKLWFEVTQGQDAMALEMVDLASCVSSLAAIQPATEGGGSATVHADAEAIDELSRLDLTAAVDVAARHLISMAREIDRPAESVLAATRSAPRESANPIDVTDAAFEEVKFKMGEMLEKLVAKALSSREFRATLPPVFSPDKDMMPPAHFEGDSFEEKFSAMQMKLFAELDKDTGSDFSFATEGSCENDARNKIISLVGTAVANASPAEDAEADSAAPAAIRAQTPEVKDIIEDEIGQMQASRSTVEFETETDAGAPSPRTEVLDVCPEIVQEEASSEPASLSATSKDPPAIDGKSQESPAIGEESQKGGISKTIDNKEEPPSEPTSLSATSNDPPAINENSQKSQVPDKELQRDDMIKEIDNKEGSSSEPRSLSATLSATSRGTPASDAKSQKLPAVEEALQKHGISKKLEDGVGYELSHASFGKSGAQRKRALSAPPRSCLLFDAKVAKVPSGLLYSWCGGHSFPLDKDVLIHGLPLQDPPTPHAVSCELKDSQTQTDVDLNGTGSTQLLQSSQSAEDLHRSVGSSSSASREGGPWTAAPAQAPAAETSSSSQEVVELRMQWSLLRERCRALERQLKKARGPGGRL